MRMIALSQEGYPPSRNSLASFGIFCDFCILVANKQVKFAELQGIPKFIPLNQTLGLFAEKSFRELASNETIDVYN